MAPAQTDAWCANSQPYPLTSLLLTQSCCLEERMIAETFGCLGLSPPSTLAATPQVVCGVFSSGCRDEQRLEGSHLFHLKLAALQNCRQGLDLDVILETFLAHIAPAEAAAALQIPAGLQPGVQFFPKPTRIPCLSLFCALVAVKRFPEPEDSSQYSRMPGPANV